MLDKQDVDELLQYMNEKDSQRELLIKKSRDVLKLSKQVIYSVHRSDIETAKKQSAEIKKEFKAMKSIAAKKPALLSVGAYRVAVQEYVEAVCYLNYVADNKIPTHKELEVDPQLYLVGLCDLTGEIVRKAINNVIKGDNESALKTKTFVEEIYGVLIKFDFRDGELRKGFDRVKYDLRRLEDVALNIKLKG